MKLVQRLLGEKDETQEEKTEASDASKDVMRVPRLIEPMLNQAALDIVDTYKSRLVREPVTYIVPAIWGAKEAGTMDRVQVEIHQKVTPVVNEVIELMDLNCRSASQRFTVGYMVKGLIISKITYMLEVLKNRLKDDFTMRDSESDNALASLEPIGNA